VNTPLYLPSRGEVWEGVLGVNDYPMDGMAVNSVPRQPGLMFAKVLY